MRTGQVILLSFVTAVASATATVFALRFFSEERDVRIPSVVDLRPDQARLLLEPNGLLLVITEQKESDTVESGHIIRQSPLEGSRVRTGSEVRVELSLGQKKIQVPEMTGVPLTEAMKRLSATSLRVGAVTRQVHESISPDAVISTIPAAGADVDRDSPVNLVVSTGKEEIKVPRVTGRWLNKAKEELEAAGLTVGKISYGYDEDLRGGLVIKQDPAAEALAPKGSAVNLVINETD